MPETVEHYLIARMRHHRPRSPRILAVLNHKKQVTTEQIKRRRNPPVPSTYYTPHPTLHRRDGPLPPIHNSNTRPGHHRHAPPIDKKKHVKYPLPPFFSLFFVVPLLSIFSRYTKRGIFHC